MNSAMTQKNLSIPLSPTEWQSTNKGLKFLQPTEGFVLLIACLLCTHSSNCWKLRVNFCLRDLLCH